MNSSQNPEAYKKLRFLLFLSFFMHIIFFSPFLNPQLVSAAQVTLEWDENTEPTLAGYMIYYGTSSGIYSFSEDVGDQTTYTLSLPDGDPTYYVALTAYDIKRLESDFSNEVSVNISRIDTDQDGLSDEEEKNIYGTRINSADSDGDGIPDGDELDMWGLEWDLDFDKDGLTNLVDADSDGDGYADGVEIIENSDPSDRFSTPQSVDSGGAADILFARFDVSEDGFHYADDVFFDTSQPDYASGTRVVSGGFTGGALQVTLGGIDNATIRGISGGWEKQFTLTSPTEIVLSFRYKMTQLPDFERDEFSRLLVSVDNTLYGQSPNDYVEEIVGNGNGGDLQTTGWRLFQVNLGVLSQGSHTLIIGGYNNKKTYKNESTQILIDDVLVESSVADGENAPPVSHDQTVTMEEGTAMPLTLSAVDPDGDSLNYSIVQEPKKGVLSGAAPNLMYTPQPDYVGFDIFTFKTNDGWADSNVATVTIRVAALTEQPVADYICVCDGLNCTFDASESYDTDGILNSYTWDFGDTMTGSGVTVTHTYQEAGTYNTSLIVTDDDEATDMSIQTITVRDRAGTMHVENLVGISASSWWWRWQAEVVILVNDANHNPLEGATVSGAWSGGTAGVSSCTTDEMGQCTVTSSQMGISSDEAIFTVDNVTHATLIYMPAENQDPDEDIHGTAITVSRR